MKNYLLILFLALIGCCWSCASGGEEVSIPEPTPEEEPRIELMQQEFNTCPAEGVTLSVEFFSTADWTAEITDESAKSWCTLLPPTKGKKGRHSVTLKFEPNDTYEERSVTIAIKAGTCVKTFVYKQWQNEGIYTNQKEYTVEAESGILNIEVNANVFYNVETTVDWIEQNTESRALETKSLSFKIAENTSDTVREGLIILSHDDKLKHEVKVIQAKKVAPPPAPETNKGTGAELESGGGIEEG